MDILEMTIPWLRSAAPALGEMAVRGLVIVFTAVVVEAVLRRKRVISAAGRHLVWLLALIGLLAAPVLSMALPGWAVLPPWGAAEGLPDAPEAIMSIPQPREPWAIAGVGVCEAPAAPAAPLALAARESAPAAPAVAAAEPVEVEVVVPTRRETSSPAAGVGVGVWLVLIWLIGAGGCLIPLVLGRLSLGLVRRRARRLDDAAWNDLLTEAAASVGLLGRVVLLESPDRSVPMIWGVFSHTLLLPERSRRWSLSRRRVVLLHELAHARRRDCLSKFIAQLARAVHWYNPLVWLAVRRMEMEAEVACDDRVLHAGGERADYAEHLLQIASNCRVRPWAACGGVAMARASRLEGRLVSILDRRANRRRLSRWAAGVVVAAAVAWITPVSVMRAATEAGSVAAAEVDASAPVGGRDGYEAAFRDLYDTLGREYSCFELKKIDWPAVGAELLPRAALVDDDREFGLLCMELLARLKDTHARLLPGSAKPPRPDWPRWRPGFVCLAGAEGRPVVYWVRPDSPAAEAGVRAGMTVEMVNGVPAELAIEDCQERLCRYLGFSSDRYLRYLAMHRFMRRSDSRKKTTYVMRDVRGDRRVFKLAATVAGGRFPATPVPIEAISDSRDVSWTMLDDRIGCIRVRRISGDLIDSLDKAVADLAEADGLIVDVRGAAGGVFDVARAHRNFSLTDNKEPWRTRFDGPMALLIDARCIAAGEAWVSWFAANRRARVFGETTAGALALQREHTLTNGLYTARFTVQAYRGYLDRAIEVRGIEPDTPVRQKASDLAAGRDTVLQAARGYLLTAKPPVRPQVAPEAPESHSQLGAAWRRQNARRGHDFATAGPRYVRRLVIGPDGAMTCEGASVARGKLLATTVARCPGPRDTVLELARASAESPGEKVIEAMAQARRAARRLGMIATTDVGVRPPGSEGPGWSYGVRRRLEYDKDIMIDLTAYKFKPERESKAGETLPTRNPVAGAMRIRGVRLERSGHKARLHYERNFASDPFIGWEWTFRLTDADGRFVSEYIGEGKFMGYSLDGSVDTILLDRYGSEGSESAFFEVWVRPLKDPAATGAAAPSS